MPVFAQPPDVVDVNRNAGQLHGSNRALIAGTDERRRYIDGWRLAIEQRDRQVNVASVVVGDLLPLLFSVVGVTQDQIPHPILVRLCHRVRDAEQAARF
jgi:hypothetical protein